MLKHAILKQASFPGYAGGTCPNSTGDYGLVHLRTPIHQTAPIKFALTHRVKQVCSAIGYGMHVDSHGKTTVEEKRRATDKIAATTNKVLTVDWKTGVADHGDSGGPLYCGGDKIAGVVSCHTDGNAPTHRREFYAVIDAAETWIKKTIAAWKPAPQKQGAAHKQAPEKQGH